MSKYGASQLSFYLLDGLNLTASLVEGVNISRENITQQTNAFGATGEEHTPVGIEKGEFTVTGGFFDAVTDALHAATGGYNDKLSRIGVITIEGNLIAKHFIGFSGLYSNKYEVQDIRDGLTKANAMYQVTGDIDEGVIALNLTQMSATWDTKTGGAGSIHAPVDMTADVTNRVIPITSNSIANPTVVTTPKPHGLVTGDKILIAGVSTSSPTINNVFVATVLTPLTFTVPVNVTVGGTGGTLEAATSRNGGDGYIQVTQYAGFTNVVCKLMHSPDDITYAALVTFTTVTAIGRERITVLGNVDRYISSQGTVTGTGTITLFMGFARN